MASAKDRKRFYCARAHFTMILSSSCLLSRVIYCTVSVKAMEKCETHEIHIFYINFILIWHGNIFSLHFIWNCNLYFFSRCYYFVGLLVVFVVAFLHHYNNPLVSSISTGSYFLSCYWLNGLEVRWKKKWNQVNGWIKDWQTD